MVDTGFSEITEERLNYSGSDPWYCEIAITGKCNFSCRYCNRFHSDLNVDLLESFLTGKVLRHIQVTGGEPTLHPDFKRIMALCRKHCVRLGLSTNGSDSVDTYLSTGTDMFSISLDDYDHDTLLYRGYQNPAHVERVITELASQRYVNVGLVIDSLNVGRIERIIDHILSLGVQDIKLSSSTKDELLPKFTGDYSKYPILSYRTERFNQGKQMRGGPPPKCSISVNDITIVGDSHYPCLVYFREKGKAIGKLSAASMGERKLWSESHDSTTDPICSKYCMDFKCEFNNSLANKQNPS